MSHDYHCDNFCPHGTAAIRSFRTIFDEIGNIHANEIIWRSENHSNSVLNKKIAIFEIKLIKVTQEFILEKFSA